MSTSQRLLGKACIVTGGSSGIGAATVRRFVNEGAEVLIADRNIKDAETLARELGESVIAMSCDVRREAEVKAVAEAAMQRWGRIDVLVNNAGHGA
jgi:NAD(P)-dependent dehydrogenase (short-subunit alcohol dehydrogenase family)